MAQPTVKFIGRTTDFKGKTLWEIVGNLKGFGVGRVIIRNMFQRYEEPCFFKVLKVKAMPNEVSRKSDSQIHFPHINIVMHSFLLGQIGCAQSQSDCRKGFSRCQITKARVHSACLLQSRLRSDTETFGEKLRGDHRSCDQSESKGFAKIHGLSAAAEAIFGKRDGQPGRQIRIEVFRRYRQSISSGQGW